MGRAITARRGNDFEAHLAFKQIYQPDMAAVDRGRDFQPFVDNALRRREAMRTRIVQVAAAEAS